MTPVFSLERNNWRWYGRWLSRLTRLPGRVRLRTFADADEAERERASLEREVRGRVNPFSCAAGLGALTTFDAGRLRDWMLDADLEPPASMAVTELEAWWVEGRFTEQQRLHVWDGLDRLRFHEVIQRPPRPLLYVVVEVSWRYNDQGFTASAEGGKPFRAYRDRARAEQECDDSNDITREHFEEILEDRGESLDDTPRRIAAVGPAGTPQVADDVPAAEAVFWEVHEVEVEG